MIKKLIIFFFINIVILQSGYAQDFIQIGLYRANQCNITILLEENNSLLFYRIISLDKGYVGKVKASKDSVIFIGLNSYLKELNIYKSNNISNNVVGEIISDNKFLIQNYGNSMNMYNIFPACDSKYLEYNKSSGKSSVIGYKSFLYDSEEKKTKMYLVKGDKVTILDEQIDKANQKWYFINYKGKKDINMWIKAEAVDVTE